MRLILAAIVLLAPSAAEAARKKRPRRERPAWLLEHAPARNTVELGAYTGLLFPSRNHELYDSRLDHSDLGSVGGALGVRIGQLPLRWFGTEFEAGGYLARTGAGDIVTPFTLRGQLLFQLPWRLAPFAVLGAGALGITSGTDELGDDIDLAWHFGAGVKFHTCDLFSIRLDIRDIVSNRQGTGTGPANHPELLFGVAFHFGRYKKKDREPIPEAAPPPPRKVLDRDGDGIDDNVDECPGEAGMMANGCPREDADEDGVFDDVDECPEEAGDAPTGCPPEEPIDTDEDGVPDEKDECPGKPGDKPKGCPPERPEEFIDRFTLSGVSFESGSAKLTDAAIKDLEKLTRALEKFPEVKVEIVGHTDSKGNDKKNRKLSLQRADAVRDQLVKTGVAKDRLSTRGAGEDEPLDSNETEDGRANNRRIEFRVIE